MKQRNIWATAFALAMATPAFANPHVDRIVNRLQSEGYHSIETERTWLGRIRIEAENGDMEREIVLNRSTGEILRDYISSDSLFLFGDEEDGGSEGGDEEGDEDEEDDEEGNEGDDDSEDDDDDDDEDDDEGDD